MLNINDSNLFRQIIDQFVVQLSGGHYCTEGQRCQRYIPCRQNMSFPRHRLSLETDFSPFRTVRTSFRSKNFDHRQTRRVSFSSSTGMKYTRHSDKLFLYQKLLIPIPHKTTRTTLCTRHTPISLLVSLICVTKFLVDILSINGHNSKQLIN